MRGGRGLFVFLFGPAAWACADVPRGADGPFDAGSDASSDAPAPRPAGDAADAGARDAAEPGATQDGAAPPSPIELPCFGDSAPLDPRARVPFAAVALGSPPSSGAFLIDFATTRSTVDLAAFPPPGPTPTGCDPSSLGATCAFEQLEFFGAWGRVELVLAAHGGATPRQAGILGTDFLAAVTITLDLPRHRVHRALASSRCAAAALSAAGLVEVSTEGFFARDAARLAQLVTVRAGADPGLRVPNVPTLPVRLAGATAVAQVDSGFDDAVVARSVNVNRAFRDAIAAASPAELRRAPAKDLELSTCAGVNERVEAYEASSPLEILDVAGGVAHRFGGVTLFVKDPPPASVRCGGIGTWTVPAAQLGASFLEGASPTVFDPVASRVFVRRR